jgi:hypothetical protein
LYSPLDIVHLSFRSWAGAIGSLPADPTLRPYTRYSGVFGRLAPLFEEVREHYGDPFGLLGGQAVVLYEVFSVALRVALVDVGEQDQPDVDDLLVRELRAFR